MEFNSTFVTRRGREWPFILADGKKTCAYIFWQGVAHPHYVQGSCQFRVQAKRFHQSPVYHNGRARFARPSRDWTTPSSAMCPLFQYSPDTKRTRGRRMYYKLTRVLERVVRGSATVSTSLSMIGVKDKSELTTVIGREGDRFLPIPPLEPD